MSGPLFLALGLLLAQALPGDPAATAGLRLPGPSGANATSPRPALAPSTASVAGQRGLDGSPPTERVSLPGATSPGTTRSGEATRPAEAAGSASPATPSGSSESGQTSAGPEHSGPGEAAAVSSGVVALAMAVVFALLVVVVYAGLLLWRRYLEYRYGNRELLANDLEFDTSDLRHFEL